MANKIPALTLEVFALETPRVERRCARCDAARRFASSGKFRINAQQRRLDVWLIYKCERCEATWNLALHERCAPERLPPALYAALLANDPALAWRSAFDTAALRRAGAAADLRVPFRIERGPRAAPPAPAELGLTLALAEPLEARLDRILMQALGAPRPTLARWEEAGLLDAGPGALRRRAADGQALTLRGDAAAAAW
jgi:hypothetical protein